jgi:hypothetical protein
MRSLNKFSILICALLVFTTACNKETVSTVGPSDVTTTTLSMSEVGRQQLEASLKTWNIALKTLATMKDYKVVDVLDSESKRANLIQELTYPSAVVAYGNVSDPQNVKLQNIAALLSQNPASAELLKTAIGKQIRVGDKVAEITWTKPDGNFTTKCIVNESGIVWDNILYNVQVVLPAVEAIEDVLSAVKTYNWAQQTNWIWGSRRGEMGYMMRINYAGTSVLTTNVETWANMNGGTAFNKGLVTQSEGAQGIAKVALGMATPVMTLNFNANDFAVNGIGADVLNVQKELHP